jgi:hypothetical protein
MLYVTSETFFVFTFPRRYQILEVCLSVCLAGPTLLVIVGCNTPKKGSAGSTANFLFGIIGNRHFFWVVVVSTSFGVQTTDLLLSMTA